MYISYSARCGLHHIQVSYPADAYLVLQHDLEDGLAVDLDTTDEGCLADSNHLQVGDDAAQRGPRVDQGRQSKALQRGQNLVPGVGGLGRPNGEDGEDVFGRKGGDRDLLRPLQMPAQVDLKAIKESPYVLGVVAVRRWNLCE